MTVTVTQLRNLADRAGRGLTPDEQARLRDGIDQLAAATDGELRRQLADAISALGRAETQLAGVRTLRDRWVKAGPPPLGQQISRWWDRRLAELGGAVNTRPADGTPPVHVGGRVNAEEQPGPAATQDPLAQDGIDTPGCDCGHHGMGASWHDDDCLWRRSVVDCPGRPTPG